MKIGIVTFPGSNCDRDLYAACSTFTQHSVVYLWHKNPTIEDCEIIFLPGGFSYGDYLRSGAIAAKSPVMDAIIRFSKKGGKVIGICNGFQILTEAHLLPGALIMNSNTRFISRNVYISIASQKFISPVNLPAYHIPIAHAEGNYFCSPDTLKSLQDNDQILFRYCDSNGKCTEQVNPNGSLYHIAGITNKSGNILGFMPHPERAADIKPGHFLGNMHGRYLLAALLSETIS